MTIDALTNLLTQNPQKDSQTETPIVQENATGDAATLESETDAPATEQNDQGATKTEFIPQILSIRKTKSKKLLVRVSHRDEVHWLFKRSRDTDRSFYVAEQLTRTRQDIFYDLKNYFKDNPDLKGTVYTRNGAPMARTEGQDPVMVKTKHFRDRYFEYLQRGKTQP